MNRRRTAALAFAACATAALSACSSTAHPGAAAVVGDQRITVSTLQAHVAAYRAAAAKDANAQEKAGITGNTLWLLVSDQVISQALAKQGLSVSQGEVQQQEAAYLQQVGSAQALQQAVVEKLYFSPGDLDLVARVSVGEDLLLKQAGVDPSATDASTALRKIMEKASKELGVTVNPRYGSWNPTGTQGLLAAKQPWLKTTAASASS